MFGIYSEDQRYDIYGYYESEDTEGYPLTWLLKQGVDPNIRNADGETVLMRALSEGDERAVNALRAYGVVN
jgi:ankyrin repeat protein